MEKVRKRVRENYLERIPLRREKLAWWSENDKVTLMLENRGVFNYIARLIAKKPPVSYIHLDEVGSFLWTSMDGRMNLVTLGIKLREKYGESVEPLYNRLGQYFAILENCGLIAWKID